jgi:glyoxylase-like metal-dependent hydrolase (beta-lactamase superfamily II)
MEVATMRTRNLVVVCLLLGLAATVSAEPPSCHEVFVRQLHPKAIVVGSGGTYGDTVIAFNSEKGLVVVDTGVSTTLTTAYRARIEEVFGRDDFAYVINTHYHYDHTVGNPVFPEATSADPGGHPKPATPFGAQIGARTPC